MEGPEGQWANFIVFVALTTTALGVIAGLLEEPIWTVATYLTSHCFGWLVLTAAWFVVGIGLPCLYAGGAGLVMSKRWAARGNAMALCYWCIPLALLAVPIGSIFWTDETASVLVVGFCVVLLCLLGLLFWRVRVLSKKR